MDGEGTKRDRDGGFKAKVARSDEEEAGVSSLGDVRGLTVRRSWL